MPALSTELTELGTALGVFTDDWVEALAVGPRLVHGVTEATWDRFVAASTAVQPSGELETAFFNGQAFRMASDGLAGRVPRRVEWRGPLKIPGDDVVPADLRIDHVYLVSCKHLSKVLLNASPRRLFERLLGGDERSGTNWFEEVAPVEYVSLYRAACAHTSLHGLPRHPSQLSLHERRQLRAGLSDRSWPDELLDHWVAMCARVSRESASRWSFAMSTERRQLQLFWRLIRITTATYFVLGSDRLAPMRLRVDSAWDWSSTYRLKRFTVQPRFAGQPEVSWIAQVQRRDDKADIDVHGHVEVRWSHGRFGGMPEAKVYLDSPHSDVPGYLELC